MGRLIERISADARNLIPRAVVVTLISLPFWILGFVVGNLFKLTFVVLAWCYSAAVIGFKDGRR